MRHEDGDVQAGPQEPGQGGGTWASRPVRLTRGNKVALGLFFALLVVLVVGSLVKLPYAVMSPGPAVNTLGDSPGTTKPIISVDGLPTYPTEGSLDFTTVRVEGGPGYPVDVWDVLQAWVDPSREVLPVDQVFDPQVSKEQVAEENAVQMEGSQEEAAAVALRALGQKVPTHIVVAAVAPSSKAKGLLLPKDRLVSVGGNTITTAESVRTALQKAKPGDTVSVVVERSGKDVTVKVPTIEGQEGRTALGIVLGIYDKLTPGALTGNHQVAGTGTIDDAGQVGPIGGIQQKLVGARSAGAEFFLAPAANCTEVVGHVPDGLQVFKVSTFDEGRTAVEAIAKGDTGSLPRC